MAKPSYEKAGETVLYDMAILAQKLGFNSPQINQLIEWSPNRQIARAALLKARKPDRYRYDSNIIESLITTIAGCFPRSGRERHRNSPRDGRLELIVYSPNRYGT